MVSAYVGALILGLYLLVKSADAFVDGAASMAKHFGMSPLMIGMLVIGFGTSAPELVVSVLSALSGNPGIALGNAYGSNISNIAMVLGFTVVMSPLVINHSILRKELPLLSLATVIAGFLIYDGYLTFTEGLIHLAAFCLLMGTALWYQYKNQKEFSDVKVDEEIPDMGLKKSLLLVLVGFTVLTASSRGLIWGGVGLAKLLGVSDVLIGLTIVAIGTSLPELASTIAAAKKGEHDIALGNIIGSNLFNTLAVVGLASVFHPMEVGAELFNRDWVIMAILTLGLFVIGGIGRKKRILGRAQGAGLLALYVAYTAYLIFTEVVV